MTMKKSELVCSILKGMGLSPVLDGGFVVVAFEMKTLVINLLQDNENDNIDEEDKYITISLHDYYELSSEDDICEVMVACNRLNRELRQIKTYITEDFQHVSSSVEFWYLNEEDLKNSIDFALYMLSRIRPSFYHALRAIHEAATE